MAYAIRRALDAISVPRLLFGQDVDALHTKAGIERAVIDVLRRLGMLPPEPPKPTPLRVVGRPGQDE